MSEPKLTAELRALLPAPRVLAYIGVGLILLAAGGPAAVASYRHAWAVALRYGGDPVMAPWLPLTTDGMIAAALTTIVVRRILRQPTGAWPICAALLGFAATIAANLAAVSTGPALDAVAVPVVAIWPPIATAITLELVVTLLRPRVSTTPVKSVGSNARPDLHPVKTPWEPGRYPPPPDTPTLAMHSHQEPAPDPQPDEDQPDDDQRPPFVDLNPTPVTYPTGDDPLAALTDADRRIRAEILQHMAEGMDPPTARWVRSNYKLGKPRGDRIHRSLTVQEVPS